MRSRTASCSCGQLPDVTAYERVAIDPVTVWHGSRSSPDRLPGAEHRALAHGAIADTTGNLGADTLAFLHGALELEIVDAVTGKRLAAAIDDRLVAAPGEQAGDRLPGDAVSWRDVEAFFDSRARRLAARLSALHQLSAPKPHLFPTTVSEETVRARLGSGSGPDRP